MDAEATATIHERDEGSSDQVDGNEGTEKEDMEWMAGSESNREGTEPDVN